LQVETFFIAKPNVVLFLCDFGVWVVAVVSCLAGGRLVCLSIVLVFRTQESKSHSNFPFSFLHFTGALTFSLLLLFLVRNLSLTALFNLQQFSFSFRRSLPSFSILGSRLSVSPGSTFLYGLVVLLLRGFSSTLLIFSNRSFLNKFRLLGQSFLT